MKPPHPITPSRLLIPLGIGLILCLFGDITLVQASKGLLGVYPDRGLGWEEWCRGKLEIIESPGDHEAILFGPRLPAVAKILQHCLDRASIGN